jgi:hypothetical protein
MSSLAAIMAAVALSCGDCFAHMIGLDLPVFFDKLLP